MDTKQKEPWQRAAARYCAENSEGFSLADLKKYIQDIYPVSDGHVSQFIEEEIQSPSGRQHSRMGRGAEGLWIPPLDLVSKVTDYDELRHARKNAKDAFWLSIVAILISVSIGAIQLLKIQNVSIQNQPIKTEIIKTK